MATNVAIARRRPGSPADLCRRLPPQCRGVKIMPSRRFVGFRSANRYRGIDTRWCG
jgi:hypothetical protein